MVVHLFKMLHPAMAALKTRLETCRRPAGHLATAGQGGVFREAKAAAKGAARSGP